MAKITLDVPDDVAEELKALEARLKRLEADKIGTEDAIPEDDIDVVTKGIALSLKRRSLQGLDIDAERVLVEGEPYVKIGRYEATYYTREGPVAVTRSLFRKCGVRNADTVDTVSLPPKVRGPYLRVEPQSNVGDDSCANAECGARAGTRGEGRGAREIDGRCVEGPRRNRRGLRSVAPSFSATCQKSIMRTGVVPRASAVNCASSASTISAAPSVRSTTRKCRLRFRRTFTSPSMPATRSSLP